MAASGLRLRSGRVLGLAPPPPPPPPPAPIPPGPVPPGVPALNTLTGLPLVLRQMILQAMFQGQPRMNLEDLGRPRDLGSLCLVNQQLKAEATEAFFRVSSFEVEVLTSIEDAFVLHQYINWGQPPQVLAPPPLPWMTLQAFRARVARAQLLRPSRRSQSWGNNGVVRMARSAGEFPWDTCYQWVKDAGPFMRDVDFVVIAPLRAYPPMVSLARDAQIRWDYPVTGLCSVRVLPGPGANVNVVRTAQAHPAGPVPSGLMMDPAGAAAAGRVYPFWAANHAGFDGQCQRAGIEANRLRQSYIPLAPPPGVPGFTGFNLRDLREIAKSFSEPSIYAIQP